ncbi:nuclear transport factor 2 family protein [Massilia agilis]|uniref:Nuclear transport factor 2 family protein n=1 Tax=Massilia agilis TaxID=1811226 RepID=A0ABT2D6E5_9BURK|nr:nuclear transport factor 2 family protein [Massilia agilis]MCS0806877.1 nuclear transport factor 2 family protein [Massilia agilis]
MDSANRIAEQYLQAWNERDPVARRAQVARVFTLEATYTDPMAASSGHLGIDTLIGAVQDKFPGFRFQLAGQPEGHHDAVRFSWTLHAPDGAAVARGTDVGLLDGDGRLASVTGFLDNVA